jgi:hypothetical protein
MSRLAALIVTVNMLFLASPMMALADTTGVPPTVHLESYTGKPTHSFAFSGNGFAPGEPVDVFLGNQSAGPLETISVDGQGNLTSQSLTIPSMPSGNYQLVFIGRTSQAPASVGFNIQGFHPWAVLDNYYIAPQSRVGFRGEDFVPGELVQVYLNTRLSDPVAQVTADGNGHFTVENAFALPNVTGGNELIFVGQQSQTEVTATFAAATPTSTNPDTQGL